MTKKCSILVVEDDPSAAQYMVLTLGHEFDHLRTAPDGIDALLAIEAQLPDLIIADLQMPRMDGLELLRIVKQRWPDLPFILVTVEQEVATIVEAIQLGASNYLVKPASPEAVLGVVRKALHSSQLQPETDAAVPEIVGVSPAMVRLRQAIALAARSDLNVLITGETGTGKELVARAIHRLSNRGQEPFVACNCALVPPDLFESEYMGYRRGAFTGAERDHPGLLRQSHGGILFLDELECMGLAHQAKLLRVLDDGAVRPIGSPEVYLVSVRYLSATNRDPAAMAAEGTLRKDLYYRLRGIEIRLPPLSERREDIRPLVAHVLGGLGAISEDALAVLCSRAWPGNVRELHNAVRAARASAGDRPIEPRHLALGPYQVADAWDLKAAGEPTMAGSEGRTLRQLERSAIAQALSDCRGNLTRAARTLGIDRSTLRRKMRDYGLEDSGGGGSPRPAGRS